MEVLKSVEKAKFLVMSCPNSLLPSESSWQRLWDVKIFAIYPDQNGTKSMEVLDMILFLLTRLFMLSTIFQ